MASMITDVFLALRHTIRGGPGENGRKLSTVFIGPDGRQRIASIILPDWFLDNGPIDLFHSAVLRTIQCQLQFCQTHGVLNSHLHDPLISMGNDDLFALWAKMGLHDAFKRQGCLILGLREILDGRAFKLQCRRSAADITKAFGLMQTHRAVGFFHSPTLEAAAIGHGYNFTGQLATDQAMVFIRRRNGLIECQGIWQSGAPLPKLGSK